MKSKNGGQDGGEGGRILNFLVVLKMVNVFFLEGNASFSLVKKTRKAIALIWSSKLLWSFF